MRDGRLHQMRRLGTSGIWEIFVPDLGPGALYKFEMHRRGGLSFLKADPYAHFAEVPPATSSIVLMPGVWTSSGAPSPGKSSAAASCEVAFSRFAA